MRIQLSSLFIWLTIAASNVLALDTDAVRKLATGDSDERTTAIAALLAEGDTRARDVMQALTNSELFVAGERILIVRADQTIDALTGEIVTPVPEQREEVGDRKSVV